MRSATGEMVRRPWTGKLDSKSAPLVSSDELGDYRAEIVDAVVGHEERGVQHRGARLVCGWYRERVLGGLDRSRREVVEGRVRDVGRYTTHFIFASLLELSPEQVTLTWRCGCGDLRLEPGDRRAEFRERATKLVVETEDSDAKLSPLPYTCQKRRELVAALSEHRPHGVLGSEQR
jgi:hypothetical protein